MFIWFVFGVYQYQCIHKTDNIFASGDKARSKASLKKNGKIQVNQVEWWEMNGFLSFRYPIALTTGGRTTEPHSPASLVVVVWFHFFDDLWCLPNTGKPFQLIPEEFAACQLGPRAGHALPRTKSVALGERHLTLTHFHWTLFGYLWFYGYLVNLVVKWVRILMNRIESKSTFCEPPRRQPQIAQVSSFPSTPVAQSTDCLISRAVGQFTWFEGEETLGYHSTCVLWGLHLKLSNNLHAVYICFRRGMHRCITHFRSFITLICHIQPRYLLQTTPPSQSGMRWFEQKQDSDSVPRLAID